MHLIGLDIGFSSKRRSNGIAELRDGTLDLRALTVQERDRKLTLLRDVDVIAIDAPLLPDGCATSEPRVVESIFSRGLFQKRCKPAMSHVPGTGRQLREQGSLTARLIEPNAATAVEAFPNTFLGVLLPEGVYIERPQLPRGKKFDWLYDRCIELKVFPSIVASGGLPSEVTDRLGSERNHDKRAALICLLTAAQVFRGKALRIGDEQTGYFYLPERSLWSEWARVEVEAQLKRKAAEISLL